MKNKLQIIKKKISQTCYNCSGKGCKLCKNTGKRSENYYYHVANGFCFDGEFIK